MSALPLRTVRRLDGKSEVKEIAGYVIERDVPMPKVARESALQDALAAMEVGESLLSGSRASDPRQRLKPKTFVSRKIGGKYRIWRVK